jgi:hypothetical protein
MATLAPPECTVSVTLILYDPTRLVEALNAEGYLVNTDHEDVVDVVVLVEVVETPAGSVTLQVKV